jgi:pimeloyl-ACP methyl ester carboxylesterase
VPLDVQKIVRAARLVQVAESDGFAADPLSVDLTALGYAAPTPLFWTEPDGTRLPCAFVAEELDGPGVAVACRGTANLWEWLDDARFGQRQCRWAPAGCLVENGFADLYDSTSLADGRGFRDLLGDPESLLVAGHSLGAAWSLLLAGEVGASECVAIASPKVGNAALAAEIERRVGEICRPVNSHDVVPLMPCSFLGLLEYVNPGPELALNSAGMVRHGPPCAHHLTTYLRLLGGSDFQLEEACKP